MHVSLLEQHEKEAALNVLVECFGEDYREDALNDINASFADYPYVPVSFLARIDGEPMGFAQTITSYFHRNTYSLLWLAVVPNYRRKGHAAQIVRAVEDYVTTKRFKGQGGSIMLVSAYSQKYYESLGYAAGLKTHDNCPIMIKHFQAL